MDSVNRVWSPEKGLGGLARLENDFNCVLDNTQKTAGSLSPYPACSALWGTRQPHDAFGFLRALLARTSAHAAATPNARQHLRAAGVPRPAPHAGLFCRFPSRSQSALSSDRQGRPIDLSCVVLKT